MRRLGLAGDPWARPLVPVGELAFATVLAVQVALLASLHVITRDLPGRWWLFELWWALWRQALLQWVAVLAAASVGVSVLAWLIPGPHRRRLAWVWFACLILHAFLFARHWQQLGRIFWWAWEHS